MISGNLEITEDLVLMYHLQLMQGMSLKIKDYLHIGRYLETS
jgi:hypothetical protein